MAVKKQETFTKTFSVENGNVGTGSTVVPNLNISFVNHLINDGSVDMLFSINGGAEFTLKGSEVIADKQLVINTLSYRAASAGGAFRLLGLG